MPKRKTSGKAHKGVPPRRSARGKSGKYTEAQTRRMFEEMEKVDPAFAETIMPFLKGLYDHYFRVDLTGWENVPEGKAIFVGNHNGLLTFEVLMMFYAWWNRFGGQR